MKTTKRNAFSALHKKNKWVMQSLQTEYAARLRTHNLLLSGLQELQQQQQVAEDQLRSAYGAGQAINTATMSMLNDYISSTIDLVAGKEAEVASDRIQMDNCRAEMKKQQAVCDHLARKLASIIQTEQSEIVRKTEKEAEELFTQSGRWT